jgi:hypothetical protein
MKHLSDRERAVLKLPGLIMLLPWIVLPAIMRAKDPLHAMLIAYTLVTIAIIIVYIGIVIYEKKSKSNDIE